MSNETNLLNLLLSHPSFVPAPTPQAKPFHFLLPSFLLYPSFSLFLSFFLSHCILFRITSFSLFPPFLLFLSLFLSFSLSLIFHRLSLTLLKVYHEFWNPASSPMSCGYEYLSIHFSPRLLCPKEVTTNVLVRE